MTQNHFTYFGLEGILVKAGQVITDPVRLKNSLGAYNAQSIWLFPVLNDQQLIGAIICNNEIGSSERLQLIQSFLTNLFNKFLAAPTTVLNPITGNALTTIKLLSDAITVDPTPPVVMASSNNLCPKPKNELEKLVDKVVHYISQNIQSPISLQSVADLLYLSPAYLSRIFSKEIHTGFIDYINSVRVAKSCELLINSNKPVKQLAKDMGYSQTSYFAKIFKRYTGMTPLNYRHANADIEKIYTLTRTPDWQDDDSVFDISAATFSKQGIPYQHHTVNGYQFMTTINDLSEIGNHRGWLFTINYQLPILPASSAKIGKAAVIQWLYTTIHTNDA